LPNGSLPDFPGKLLITLLIFDLAKNLNLQISETAAGIDALKAADEIFLTSAGIEICSGQKFNDKIYQNDIARKLQKAFFDSIN